MPYDFAENEYELEPRLLRLTEADRRASKPESVFWIRPFPPKRPPGPIPTVPPSLLFRVVAGLLLAGIAVLTFFLLFALR